MQRRTPVCDHVTETPFLKALLVALGSGHPWRVHRQNCGEIIIRDHSGTPIRTFRAGPPKGACDISGWTIPDGYRLEIEVKADGGKLSPEQLAWAKAVSASGVVYALIEYDDSRSMPENISRAIDTVRAAIADRRKLNA